MFLVSIDAPAVTSKVCAVPGTRKYRLRMRIWTLVGIGNDYARKGFCVPILLDLVEVGERHKLRIDGILHHGMCRHEHGKPAAWYPATVTIVSDECLFRNHFKIYINFF